MTTPMNKTYDLILNLGIECRLNGWATTEDPNVTLICKKHAANLFKPKGSRAAVTVSQPSVEGEEEFYFNSDFLIIAGLTLVYYTDLRSILEAGGFNVGEPMSVKWEELS